MRCIFLVFFVGFGRGYCWRVNSKYGLSTTLAGRHPRLLAFSHFSIIHNFRGLFSISLLCRDRFCNFHPSFLFLNSIASKARADFGMKKINNMELSNDLEPTSPSLLCYSPWKIVHLTKMKSFSYILSIYNCYFLLFSHLIYDW